jgi:hypothetical protein
MLITHNSSTASPMLTLKYMNVEERNHVQPRWMRDFVVQEFVVPDDFDKTPPPGTALSRLDSFLCDKSVFVIITCMYTLRRGGKWETWALENPADAKLYFSRPYCETAVRELGYPDMRASWLL